MRARSTKFSRRKKDWGTYDSILNSKKERQTDKGKLLLEQLEEEFLTIKSQQYDLWIKTVEEFYAQRPIEAQSIDGL